MKICFLSRGEVMELLNKKIEEGRDEELCKWILNKLKEEEK